MMQITLQKYNLHYVETEGCSQYHTCHVKQHATWIGKGHLFFVERYLNLINPSRNVMAEFPNGISNSIVLQKKSIRLNFQRNFVEWREPDIRVAYCLYDDLGRCSEVEEEL